MSDSGKVCTRCGEWKPYGDYSPNRKMRSGRQSRCKVCCRDGLREYYARVPYSERRYPRTPEQKEARWGKEILSRYGLTVEQYQELEREQGGVCAICGGGPNGPGSRLHVDHCHETGKVRGLLCGRCNTAIGLFDESADRMARATKYLEGK